MQKLLFLSALMLSAIGASAQTVIELENSNFSVLPGSNTYDGQSIVYYQEMNDDKMTITLADTDFKTIRSFNHTIKSYPSTLWREKSSSTFVPTNVLVDESSLYCKPYDFYDYGTKEFDASQITSPEQLEELLSWNSTEKGESIPYIGFYDYKGRISYGRPSNSNFYLPLIFGHKYPFWWYFIEDGVFYNASASSLTYSPEIPDNLDYEPTSDFGYLQPTLKENIVSFSLSDYDNGISIPSTLTQTLFNDDEKFEFLETEHQYTKIWYDNYFTSIVHDDEGNTIGFHAYRTANSDSKLTAYHVKNEDNQIIMSFRPIHENSSFSFYNGFILNKHVYLRFDETVYEGEQRTNYITLYRIDKEHNSAEMVKTVKADGRFASAHEGMVNVSIDAADSGSEVILTNAAGQVVGHDHIGQGQTSATIHSPRLQHGVYNVSLRRDGRIIKNEKLMIK